MQDLISLLDKRPDLRDYLFCRGFLLTDAKVDIHSFPFYGNWNTTQIGHYFAYTHRLQKVTVVERVGRSFFLFGHAYNPFTMCSEERQILDYIAEAYGTADYQDRIDEITGVFVYGVIEDDCVQFLVDPSGMQSAYYGALSDSFFLASHAQIIGDLCGLEINSLTKELIDYKWYHRVMGDYLPGDMTQFDQVRRIVPSIAYLFSENVVTHKRFWPLKDIDCVEGEQYKYTIKSAATILKNNMALIARKWEQPYISLTGGIDSNTTFSAANGIYDRFKAFSYVSAEKEVIDANAAKEIAEHFGVPFLRFDIPESPDELPDYQEIVEIIKHNDGHIITQNGNEYRKRVYLIKHLDCDVEVKSWVSETIRAYWYKHYGRKDFPPLSPKLFRNLYKIFIANRNLAHKIDDVFAKYIKEFDYESIPSSYPIADMHYNEVTWGSWGGPNISEMKIYSDITFIYNNRKFFDLMFRIPLEKRIRDEHHLDMKKEMNKELYDLNIRVKNMKETNLRAFLLNCIFVLNEILP